MEIKWCYFIKKTAFFFFYSFVSLKGAPTTLNDKSFVSLAVEDVDI